MKSISLVGALVIGLFGLSLAQNTPKLKINLPDGAQPYNHLEIQDDEGRFHFAIVTDRTGGHRPGVFMDGVNKLNLLQPSFVMSVGDLIEGYTEDLAEIDRQWNEFDGFVDQLDMPFFYVVGNHDYTNPVMAKIWQERLGPSYYHFVYKDVLFIALNSEEPVATGGRTNRILQPQFDYVKKVLEENQDVKWTLLFLHKPLWTYAPESSELWPEVEKLLADRKHTVFAGHHHHYIKHDYNNGKYFMLATTGGGSRLRGPQLGEFDHVVWVTMTEQGPVIANLMLEGIWDENVVTEEGWEKIGPVSNLRPLRIEPLIGDGEMETELRLTNESDVPMTASLAFSRYQQLRPDMAEMTVEVGPNSVEQISLKVEQMADFDGTAPLHLKATYAYAFENMPPVELSTAHNLLPIKWVSVPFRKKKVKVDGDLKDWESLAHHVDQPVLISDPFAHRGAEDLDLSFEVAYDNEFLYLAARVKDDEILVDTNRSAYQQDGILFQVDGRPAAISANEVNGWAAYSVFQNPGMTPAEEGRVYRRNRIPEDIQMACRRTEDGFVAEMAIPLSTLNTLQGGDWKDLRVNIGVMDYDRDYKHSSRLYWQPDWGSEDNFVGSGLMRKDVLMDTNPGRK